MIKNSKVILKQSKQRPLEIELDLYFRFLNPNILEQLSNQSNIMIEFLSILVYCLHDILRDTIVCSSNFSLSQWCAQPFKEQRKLDLHIIVSSCMQFHDRASYVIEIWISIMDEGQLSW